MIDRFFPGVQLGDFTEERTCLLGSVTDEAEAGRLLRTLWVLADQLDGDPTRYWSLSVGRFNTGGFVEDKRTSFPGGFPVTPVRIEYEGSGVRVPRGSLLAIRVSPSGPDVVPLTGVSVVPEFAESSPRTG